MFRITEDPSSGSLVQCLAKNYRNYSIVSIDMDNVGVMAAYYVHNIYYVYNIYAAIIPTLSMSMDMIKSFILCT